MATGKQRDCHHRRKIADNVKCAIASKAVHLQPDAVPQISNLQLMHHSLLLDNRNRTDAVDLNNAVDVNTAMLTRCHVSAINMHTIEERLFMSIQEYCCRN